MQSFNRIRKFQKLVMFCWSERAVFALGREATVSRVLILWQCRDDGFQQLYRRHRHERRMAWVDEISNGEGSERWVIMARGCGGAGCRRCWWVMSAAECWVCFPVMCCDTQGRLAEARLTLGSTTQPLWGWGTLVDGRRVRPQNIADAEMNYERCLINQQVENGSAVRMSVL